MLSERTEKIVWSNVAERSVIINIYIPVTMDQALL